MTDTHARLFAFWLGLAMMCGAIMYIRWQVHHELWWWFMAGVGLGLRLAASHFSMMWKQRR